MNQEKNFEESLENPICEEWKPVNNFEGMYMVSNMGRVKSLDRIIFQKDRSGNISKHIYKGKILKKCTQVNGYETIDLHKNSKTQRYLVHRLVAEHFLEKPKGKEYINHKDNTRNNNIYTNLEWCTQSENIQYAYDNGTKIPPHQRKVYQCKKNGEIIKLWESLAQACRELKIYESNIAKVCNGKRSQTGGYKWKYAD